MILLVAFGTADNGNLWVQKRYNFETIADAVETGEGVDKMEGFFVVHFSYDAPKNADEGVVVYEHNTDGYLLSCSPFVKVMKEGYPSCPLPV